MTPDIEQEWIDAVRRELDRQGMTQRQLADAVGISYSHVSLLLSGRRRWYIEMAQQVADVLEADVRLKLVRRR